VTHELILSCAPFLGKTKHACFSPLYWSTGFYPNFSHVSHPNSLRIITKERFNIPSIIKLVEKYEINYLTAATYILGTLLNSNEFLSSKNQSLQIFSIGGSVVLNHTRKRFSEIFPKRHLQVVLGMTEMGRITLTKGDEYKIDGAVGSWIQPNASLRIIDENGNWLGFGEVGEVYGRNGSKFMVS
jgi:acyl-CoA synthetase (AMP-forming)/AMP-acid ligase II